MMDQDIDNKNVQPIDPTSTQTEQFRNETIHSFSWKRAIFVFLGAVILAGLLVTTLFLYWNSLFKSQKIVIKPVKSTNISSPTKIFLTSSNFAQTVFAGNLIPLSQDLGLILPYGNSGADPVRYYEAGVGQNGKYKGYTRFISLQTYQIGLGPDLRIFVTMDKKNFIIDNEDKNIGYFLAGNYNTVPDRTKIAAQDDLTGYIPQSIQLDKTFGLYRSMEYLNDIYLAVTGVKTNSIGQKNLTYALPMNLSTLKPLPVLPNGTQFYEIDNKTNPYFFVQPNNLSGSSTAEVAIFNQYVDTNSQVIYIDQAGIPYEYNIALNAAITSYPQKLAQWNSTIHPDSTNLSPEIIPHIEFNKNDVTTNDNLFTSYQRAFPQRGDTDSYTFVVKNVSMNDLKKIGTLHNSDIFTLKDNNHPLNVWAYNSIHSGNGGQCFTDKKNPYNQQTYINKHPLLFLKDPWGRLIMVGEFEVHQYHSCF